MFVLPLQGVVEFSLCLFFSKLVSYTFLFWLPKYISATSMYLIIIFKYPIIIQLQMKCTT